MSSPKEKSKTTVKKIISQPGVNSFHLFVALNATVAVQRVRSRQQQSEEGKEEPSVLVSQVLNPEMPLNQSGNIRRVSVKCVIIRAAKCCNNQKK